MTKKRAREIVENFKGEFITEYKSIYEYVIYGGWERDYFSAWLERCSDYPCLEEIINFCKETELIIELYCMVVEDGDEEDEKEYFVEN